MEQIQTPALGSLQRESLVLTTDQLNIFFPLLQHGITIPAIVGCPLKNLLCEQLSIPADYVTDRITTIFLDNRPVDNLEQTIIHNGSRVTLSAAMPGLVGATMRRGGFYAAMRGGISHCITDNFADHNSGTIRLKLFNLLLAEVGPLILQRGLILSPEERAELRQNLPALLSTTDTTFLTVTSRE